MRILPNPPFVPRLSKGERRFFGTLLIDNFAIAS